MGFFKDQKSQWQVMLENGNMDLSAFRVTKGAQPFWRQDCVGDGGRASTKEQTLTSSLEGLGNFLEELSFKQRPKERGQGRDGERSHGGKRENFIFLGATRGSFCNREEGH